MRNGLREVGSGRDNSGEHLRSQFFGSKISSTLRYSLQKIVTIVVFDGYVTKNFLRSGNPVSDGVQMSFRDFGDLLEGVKRVLPQVPVVGSVEVQEDIAAKLLDIPHRYSDFQNSPSCMREHLVDLLFIPNTISVGDRFEWKSKLREHVRIVMKALKHSQFSQKPNEPEVD
jgi:hypothetical protein